MHSKRHATMQPMEQIDRAEAGSALLLPGTAIFLTLCTLICFALGVYRIDFYSIWLDENTTLVTTSDWMTLKAFLSTFPEQHPVYYVLIKWLGVNHSLLGIRYFSLACTILTIYPVYYVAMRIFSSDTARMACILFVLSPFCLYYSQEGRMYALFIFLAILQVGLLVAWVLDSSRAAKIGFVAVSILLMYTHFFSSFLLAGEFLWLCATRLKKDEYDVKFPTIIGIFFLIGLAYSPWLLHIILNLGGMSQSWRSPYNIVFSVPYTFFRFAAGYGIFPLNYEVKLHMFSHLPAALFWGLIACAAYLPAAFLVAKRIKQVTMIQGLVFVLAFFPSLLVVAASFFKNVGSERYVVYSAPFVYMLVASTCEAGTGTNRFLKMSALYLPVGLFIAGIGFHYFNPAFGKTNYKAAAAYILKEDSRAVRVLCSPDVVAGPMHYYLKDKMMVTRFRSWRASSADTDVWLVERLANMPSPLLPAGDRFAKISEKVFAQENGLRVTHWLQSHPGQDQEK